MQIGGVSSYHYAGGVRSSTQPNQIQNISKGDFANKTDDSSKVQSTTETSSIASNYDLMDGYLMNYLDERGKEILSKAEESTDNISNIHKLLLISAMTTNAEARFEEKFERTYDANSTEDRGKLHEIMANGEFTKNESKNNSLFATVGENFTEYILKLGSGVNAINNPNSLFTHFATLYNDKTYTPLDVKV